MMGQPMPILLIFRLHATFESGQFHYVICHTRSQPLVQRYSTLGVKIYRFHFCCHAGHLVIYRNRPPYGNAYYEIDFAHIEWAISIDRYRQ